jgi:hypothetical protein
VVKYSLRDVNVPTRVELEKKDPVKVVDISIAQTTGRFADRRRQILKNAERIISKPYLNRDTKTLIFLTEKSYTHAFNNLGAIQLNALEHLPELVENAVLTHSEAPTHGSEYTDGVYTFFAAARAKQIMPVKLKVKEYNYVGQLLPKNIRDETLVMETQQHVEFGDHHSDRVFVDTVQQFRHITGYSEQKSSAAATWIKEHLPILKGQQRNHLCRYFAGRIIRAILIFLPLGRTGLIDDPEQIGFILRKFSIYDTSDPAVRVFRQNSLNIGVIKNSSGGKKVFRNRTQQVSHGKSRVVQCGQYIQYSKPVILIYKEFNRHDFFCRQPFVCPSGKAGTFFCL